MSISKDLADWLQGTKDQYEALAGEIGEIVNELDQDSYFNIVKCPSCSRAYNIIHFECGNYIDACSCGKEKEEVYYCNPCDIVWSLDTGEMIENFTLGNSITSYDDENWEDEYLYDDVDYGGYSGYDQKDLGKKNSLFDDEVGYEIGQQVLKDLANETTKTLTTTTSTTKSTTTTTAWTSKCSHRQTKMELFDGTPIHCSSLRGLQSSDDPKPDFGLYADYQWSPTWRNEFIHWPDYNIPSDEKMGLVQISDAYIRATKGEMVEIGCIGGHGRTGTILAIMYIASAEGEVTPQEAIKYVKEKYCSSAIESDIQEWYIKFASHVWFGTEVGEKPTTSWGTKGWGCQVSDHSAMMLRGHTYCADNGKNCKYWSQDWNNFWREKDKITEYDMKALKNAINQGADYDYVYGGLIRFEDDPDVSPCSALEHYVMICLGHEDECLRYGKDCGYWDQDLWEWKEDKTIGGNSDWTSLSESAKELYELYPSAEELAKEGHKIIPSIFPPVEKKTKATTTTTVLK